MQDDFAILLMEDVHGEQISLTDAPASDKHFEAGAGWFLDDLGFCRLSFALTLAVALMVEWSREIFRVIMCAATKFVYS